jgi:hypothetical protein
VRVRLSEQLRRLLGVVSALLQRQLDDESNSVRVDAVGLGGIGAGVGAGSGSGSLSSPVPSPPTRPPMLSRFASIPKAIDDAAPGGSVHSRAAAVAESSAWMPLFAPEPYSRLQWARVLSSQFASVEELGLTPDEVNRLWTTYAPATGDMSPVHLANVVKALREVSWVALLVWTSQSLCLSLSLSLCLCLCLCLPLSLCLCPSVPLALSVSVPVPVPIAVSVCFTVMIVSSRGLCCRRLRCACLS